METRTNYDTGDDAPTVTIESLPDGSFRLWREDQSFALTAWEARAIIETLGRMLWPARERVSFPGDRVLGYVRNTLDTEAEKAYNESVE